MHGAPIGKLAAAGGCVRLPQRLAELREVILELEYLESPFAEIEVLERMADTRRFPVEDAGNIAGLIDQYLVSWISPWTRTRRILVSGRNCSAQ